MTFDSRCVCPQHGWPPDLIADRDRAREALRLLDDVVTAYMLGDVDGAAVAQAQHTAREALPRVRS